MLAYKDCAPKQISPVGLLKAAEYESFNEAVAAANAWIERKGVDVINVETVVLPSLSGPHSEGSTDPNVVLQPSFAATWNQFIRVWYRIK